MTKIIVIMIFSPHNRAALSEAHLAGVVGPPTHRELSLHGIGLRRLLVLPSVGPFPPGRRFGLLRSPGCLGRANHKSIKE